MATVIWFMLLMSYLAVAPSIAQQLRNPTDADQNADQVTRVGAPSMTVR
jgi:hypothetical protein